MMWNDPALLGYMMECEGETDTHEGRVISFARQLAIAANPWEEETQNVLLASCGLSRSELCLRDYDTIKRESGISLCI